MVAPPDLHYRASSEDGSERRITIASETKQLARISAAQRKAARKNGALDALGVPAAGMLGFGALAFDSGLDVVLAAACTAGIWALPGQIALIEMHVAGAPGALTVLAVMLTAARFLPMTISLMSVIRQPASPPAPSRLPVYYFARRNLLVGVAAGVAAIMAMRAL